MSTAELNDGKYQGKVYQPASGGIAPAILAGATKIVLASFFVGQSAGKIVGILCDAHGHHWDVEVLKATKDGFFCAITGVPNATGLWQIADMHSTGVLKVKWVQAKSILMDRKRADHALPAEARRVTGPGEDKPVPSDYVILLNMAFAPSHANTAKNLEVIAKSGVSPFTKALFEHPEVAKGSSEGACCAAAPQPMRRRERPASVAPSPG